MKKLHFYFSYYIRQYDFQDICTTNNSTRKLIYHNMDNAWIQKSSCREKWSFPSEIKMRGKWIVIKMIDRCAYHIQIKIVSNAFTIIQNEISNKNANVQQNNDTIFIQWVYWHIALKKKILLKLHVKGQYIKLVYIKQIYLSVQTNH